MPLLLQRPRCVRRRAHVLHEAERPLPLACLAERLQHSQVGLLPHRVARRLHPPQEARAPLPLPGEAAGCGVMTYVVMSWVNANTTRQERSFVVMHGADLARRG